VYRIFLYFVEVKNRLKPLSAGKLEKLKTPSESVFVVKEDSLILTKLESEYKTFIVTSFAGICFFVSSSTK